MDPGDHGRSHAQSECREAVVYTPNLPELVCRDGSTAHRPEGGLGYLPVLQKEPELRALSCHCRGIVGMVPWRPCPQQTEDTLDVLQKRMDSSGGTQTSQKGRGCRLEASSDLGCWDICSKKDSCLVVFPLAPNKRQGLPRCPDRFAGKSGRDGRFTLSSSGGPPTSSPPTLQVLS